MKQSHYEATVIEFVQNTNGCFIAATEDSTFIGVLRAVLNKDLALNAGNLLYMVQESDKIIKTIRDIDTAGRIPLLFMERRFKEQDAAPIIQQINSLSQNLNCGFNYRHTKTSHYVLAINWGADNFIAKPVSANTVVQKWLLPLNPKANWGS